MFQDLRSAFRTLRKGPAFSLMVMLILGLGLGATIALLDLVNLLAWRQIPVGRPHELVKVFTASARGFVGPYHSTTYPDYLDYRDANHSFSGLAAHMDIEWRLGHGEVTDYAWGAVVSGNFFEVLQLGATLGRPLMAADDRAGSPPMMVIAHHLWERLGRDPEVIGTTLSVEGREVTVVGVGPAGYTSTIAGTVTDFFVPIAALPVILGERGKTYLEDRVRARMYLTGRLRPGVSRDTAEAELALLAAQIDERYPLPEGAKRQITLTRAQITHPVDLERMRPTLRLAAAAVALLLIITCANVAHLMLAWSSARHREMGIRQSIGASRWRLARQVLSESLLLAIGGGLCGMLLAYWARAFFAGFTSPEFAGEMRFDLRVIGASFGACLATTVLFGLWPAIAASRVHLVSALKVGSDGHRGRRFSAGQWLSAAQVALCLVLLTAGALLAQSLWHRLEADLGFDDENLLIARLDLPGDAYSRAEGQAFYRLFRERAQTLPAVEQAGLALLVPPLLFDISLPFHLPEDPDTGRSSRINFVDAGYFHTLGISLEAGRLFDSRDTDSGQAVVVVNRHLAEQLWPGEDPIGRTLRSQATRPGDPGPEFMVIGVVSTISQHRSGLGGEPVIYYAASQRHRPTLQLIPRSAAEPAMVFESLRRLLRDMDPQLALHSLRTGPRNRRDAFTLERIQTQMVGVFAILGLLLAMLGIFGVLSYAVSRQVREVGIRMALGARRQDVLRHVVGQGLLATLLGIAAGLVGTLFSARLLERQLYGISAGDPRILAAVVILVLGAAALAAYLPARRAARLDPLEALRHE